MANKAPVTTLFTDIGGVLLTNGWDHNARYKAVDLFNLDLKETEERHHLTFDTYEVGKLSLDEYLDRVVFYEERKFTKDDFREFMYSQSQPLPGMIEYYKEIKKKYNLKIAVISNEGRELNDYRIQKFELASFIDFFISSSFVHFRKPDVDIFKVAIDVAQSPIDQSVYIDDRSLFVQVAEGLGLTGIIHRDVKDTCAQLEALGLSL